MKHKVCDLLVAKPLNCQQIPKKSKKGLGIPKIPKKSKKNQKKPREFQNSKVLEDSRAKMVRPPPPPKPASKSIGFPKPFLEFFGIFNENLCFPYAKQ